MKLKTFGGNNLNDTTNYVAVLHEDFYGLTAVQPAMSARRGRWPVFGALERPGRQLTAEIFVRGSTVEALQNQLYQWLDPEDETPAELVVEDNAGGNDRYVMAVCESLQEFRQAAGLRFLVTWRVDGDVRWREKTASTKSWSITGTGQTTTATNNGKDDAYPVITIRPTGAKSGGVAYAYKRWIPVRWNLATAYTNYPVDITADSLDTDALVSGGKMQDDGDDLRVTVDGVEVDRWLSGINTTTTQVWVNLSFAAKAEGTLKTAIADEGAVTEIELNEDISGFPSAGIVMIESEAFQYTGKSPALRKFTGVTRSVRGTSAAAHSASTAAWWVQHDIWILYGNAGVSAPATDDTYKPAIEVTSTNTSWVYANSFRDTAGLRPAGWVQDKLKNVEFYGGNRGATADPWVEAGTHITNSLYEGEGRIKIYNPCGITNANFTNGEKYANSTGKSSWSAAIQSSLNGSTWTDEYTIAAPGEASAWEAWTRSEDLATGSVWVGLHLEDSRTATGVPAYASQYLEADDCTLTLNSTYTPTVTVGAEQSNYSLTARITNSTTGEAIDVTFDMQLNQYLEIDTDDKTVTYLADNSSQFQALELVGGARKDWLRLQPGNNTLQFDDTGTAAVTVALSWEERHYQ